MRIVIPMSGFGQRFRRAGYSIPKPLIEVQGKPIISHVDWIVSRWERFYIQFNEEHLRNEEYETEKTIRKYCPEGKIVAIPPHRLGPVHAVLRIKELLVGENPVVVNYRDFSCYWNWQNFKKVVFSTGCAGPFQLVRVSSS